jgi:hypothetical protein
MPSDPNLGSSVCHSVRPGGVFHLVTSHPVHPTLSCHIPSCLILPHPASFRVRFSPLPSPRIPLRYTPEPTLCRCPAPHRACTRTSPTSITAPTLALIAFFASHVQLHLPCIYIYPASNLPLPLPSADLARTLRCQSQSQPMSSSSSPVSVNLHMNSALGHPLSQPEFFGISFHLPVKPSNISTSFLPTSSYIPPSFPVLSCRSRMLSYSLPVHTASCFNTILACFEFTHEIFLHRS